MASEAMGGAMRRPAREGAAETRRCEGTAVWWRDEGAAMTRRDADAAMTRRDLIGGTAAALALAAAGLGGRGLALAETPGASVPAAAGAVSGFGFADVAAMARARAGEPFEDRRMTLRPPFADLSYDRYRGIRFREEMRLMAGNGGAFAVDLLPPGHVYRDRVSVSLVRGGAVETVGFDPGAFDFSSRYFDLPEGRAPAGSGEGLAHTGLRLRHPLNSPDVMDEFLVFQGASYFRAVARGMIYGLSARGLAIGTADARGEEFPVFTDFWIHEPAPAAREITVDALLDSPSCTGAFRFEVQPGETTVMETRCRLFPRREIETIGIAPLTSMYFFGPEGRARVDDFRDAVHDSAGLQMVTGTGLRLWRTLANPVRVQFSAFQDDNPKGFGLTQRARDFDYYQDDEARYERRPSAWVEPLGAWGPGSVVLVEIPVENEFNDNVVAFWRPAAALGPREEGHDFAYRLHWCDEPPDAVPLARVHATRGGASIHDPAARVFAVDFERGEAAGAVGELTARLFASAGEAGPVVLRELPGGTRLRATFEFRPGDAELAELELVLEGAQGREAERWLYRWTAS